MFDVIQSIENRAEYMNKRQNALFFVAHDQIE